MKPIVLLMSVLWLSCGLVLAQEQVIFDMDSVRHQPNSIEVNRQKVPCGTVSLVDGKFNKAVRFTFVENARGGFFTAPIRPTPAWDSSAGFSFWVKGDGSSGFGGIELVDRENFSLRYGYCFPIDSNQWKKIIVRWTDLTPELAAPMIGNGGYAPSHLGNFWFGKWFYWRNYPAESYAIDQVMLEPTIQTPAIPAVPGGLERLRKKLADHKPITLVTMGDSLTDKAHWANKEKLWCELLAQAIKNKYGSEVKLINPAIGGTTLSQNMVLMPRWLKDAPSPDLVIIWFGYNDWDTGVRGQRFAEYLRMAVDRIRIQTRGSADILLMTTHCTPSRWQTMRELEEAVRTVAHEKQTALVDIAAEFRKPGSPEASLKAGYWARDQVHLGAKGHELVEQTILRQLTEK